MAKKGIDVSVHNGNVNWKTVKQNIDFAIIRAGYGKYANQKDKQLDNNVKGCESNNIPYGFYWYSYAKSPSEAKLEAQVCYDIIKNFNPAYPIFFDLEDNSQYNLGKQTLTDMVKEFCEYLISKGCKVGLYSNLDWLQNRLGDVSKYDIWLAQWANKATYNKSYTMWQYSSNGSVPGISGRVDMNYCYVDYDNTSKPTTTPNTNTKKSTNQLVVEVFEGKWGNGDTRKQKLKAAGYDYDTVQSAVNKTLAVAKEVIVGKYGNGEARKTKLKAAGYDYSTVQAVVNLLMK